MYSFKSDYSEGAHPRLIERFLATNQEQTIGYGEDDYSIQAQNLIKKLVKNPNSQVHLLVGGTQTNLITIAAFLRSHEAVIAVESGHVAVHEAGAIEATGHKVIVTKGKDGKLYPEDIEKVLAYHVDEHMVRPKLVYISDSTEIGTIYTLKELEALSATCKKHRLIFYVDGARLGSALMSPENDVTLADLGRLTDAFYIGGTKNGALFGEALVINNPDLQEDFRYHLKQKGAMLAKGRLLGLQFLALFEDDLFFEIGQHANNMALRLQEGLSKLGVEFFVASPTNQIFPIFHPDTIAELRCKYLFQDWEKLDDTHIAVRLVTSWATSKEAVDAFLEDAKESLQKA
jgi:threonine aldolase